MWGPRAQKFALIAFLFATPFLFVIPALRLVVAGLSESDPSEKASLLAAGISEAINCFAFGVLFAIAIAAIVIGLRRSSSR